MCKQSTNFLNMFLKLHTLPISEVRYKIHCYSQYYVINYSNDTLSKIQCDFIYLLSKFE